MLVFLNKTPLYLKCPRRERLESLELSNANQEISCTRLHFLFKERYFILVKKQLNLKPCLYTYFFFPWKNATCSAYQPCCVIVNECFGTEGGGYGLVWDGQPMSGLFSCPVMLNAQEKQLSSHVTIHSFILRFWKERVVNVQVGTPLASMALRIKLISKRSTELIKKRRRVKGSTVDHHAYTDMENPAPTSFFF